MSDTISKLKNTDQTFRGRICRPCHFTQPVLPFIGAVQLAGLHGLLFLLFLVTAAAQQQPHPAYESTNLAVASSPSHSRDENWKPGDNIALEISGMTWLGGDRLAVCIRKGDVLFIDGVLGDPKNLEFHTFASGLHEPLGLLSDKNGDLLVCQRAEVTRLRDRDNDGRADAYLTAGDGWNVSGNYHAYAYGPVRDGKGNLWVTLNLGMGNFANNKIGWRGWGGTIGPDRKFQPRAFGMRSPSGIGANLAGDLFFSDQQGTWIPATPIYHLRPGVFYGNQESKESLKLPDAPFQMNKFPENRIPYPEALESVPEFVPPAVWLPYNKMGRSATDIQVIPEGKTGNAFGPFSGQLLIGEFTNCLVSRVFLEKVGGAYQGACFPFLKGFPAAVLRLCFADDGSLFVGMSNRGWTSLGNRSYGLARVRRTGDPFSIAEMRAKPDGFELTFTQPVDLKTLKKEAFQLSSYTYQYSSAYGGDEIDKRELAITSVEPGKNGKSVRLRVDGLRRYYVHELTATGITSRAGVLLDYPKAYYTLNVIPREE